VVERMTFQMSAQKVKETSPFFIPTIFINKITMKKIIITEDQLNNLKSNLKEDNEKSSYMAKQQLFTIATLAYKMWEQLEDGEQLDDWMESKVAQVDQNITSVVKAYFYDEVEDSMKDINLDDLVIGK
jgi:P2-related tail formation protein